MVEEDRIELVRKIVPTVLLLQVFGMGVMTMPSTTVEKFSCAGPLGGVVLALFAVLIIVAGMG